MNSPSDPIVLNAVRTRASLDPSGAIQALECAFKSGRLGVVPQRTHLDIHGGDLLVMPAVGEDSQGQPLAGVKVVSVSPSNASICAPTVQGIYALFGGPSMAPLALMAAPPLTDLRTSAVSALATKYLARPDSKSLLLFGAGAQALAHLKALGVVMPIQNVTIVSRSLPRADRLVRQAQAMGFESRLGKPDDVAVADIICCCTTSSGPLFDGSSLRPGCHVVAVGAYRPTMRELDEITLSRGQVVVEERDLAFAEAGEFAIPAAAGNFSRSGVSADLRELLHGAEVRRSETDITVFKSVGTAGEDLIVAEAVYRSAVAST